MFKYVKQTARAIFAAAVMFVGSLGTALTVGQAVGDLDAKTWCWIAGSTLVSFGGVYGISNGKP